MSKIFAAYNANRKYVYNLEQMLNAEAEKRMFMILPIDGAYIKKRRGLSTKLVGVTWVPLLSKKTIRILFP